MKIAKFISILIVVLFCLLLTSITARADPKHIPRGHIQREIVHERNAIRKLNQIRDRQEMKELRDVQKDFEEITKLSKIKEEASKWSYNPNDDRGQGNTGKPEMIAPFGHDKDSDRKEVYGNRGRIIKQEEPEPEPPPPPDPDPEEPTDPEDPTEPPALPFSLKSTP